MRPLLTSVCLAALCLPACTPQRVETAAAAAKIAAPRAAEPVHESDEYTRYELLAPETSSFHILFEVTAITPGATTYFNPIRKGSAASGEKVTDVATSQALPFEVVSGAEARQSGLPEADVATDFIRVHLPRPVPAEGGVRLLIDKTYQDAKSYFRKSAQNGVKNGADRIVFTRTLGIRRNAIVLPSGYEPVACNAPAQVLTAADGRRTVTFMHSGPEAFPLTIEARKVEIQSVTAITNREDEKNERLAERAHQDRTIVYFLQPPETHAFDLYHDYTESRPGIDRYLNVVRKGSTASNPAARNLDTGETLKVETLKGDAVLASGSASDEGVKPDDDVVVAHFAAVPPHGSVRLRISETYTDPKSYRLEGDELVFDRTFGRPRNSVVLPAGWSLTASSIPATVRETPDGRVRLDFVNNRPDEIAVLIKAQRRSGS